MTPNYRKLVITKDEQAFQQSDPLLLLGDWCSVDYPEESIMPDFEYVYNPLSDNDEREKHYYYIQKVSSRLMVRMANKLNAYHKVAFSNKDWKMLLGHYIPLLSHASYVKWLLIQNAYKVNNIKTVRLPIFDDLVEEPELYVNQICKDLNIKKTSYLRKIFEEENLPRKIDLKQRELKLTEIRKTASKEGLALLDKMVEKFEDSNL